MVTFAKKGSLIFPFILLICSPVRSDGDSQNPIPRLSEETLAFNLSNLYSSETSEAFSWPASYQAVGEAPSATPEALPMWAPLFAFRPRVSLGFGEFSYEEEDFDLVPGLDSEFKEPVFWGQLGCDFAFRHHGVTLDFDFFHTATGTERWEEFGSLVQKNELNVWRLGLELGYFGSTWDRSRPSSMLRGASRYVRFGGGFRLYYRHQHFTREDFELYDASGQLDEVVDTEVEEKFDMLGGEFVIDFEVGPRHYAAGFIRGKGGGGLVVVTNDIFEPDEEDFSVTTASVQGTVEAGVVSQPIRFLEVRGGVRYHHLEVFGEDTKESGITVELPDNTTQIYMIFIEVTVPLGI